MYRHALDVDDRGEQLLLGSTTGSLWYSGDAGDIVRRVSRRTCHRSTRCGSLDDATIVDDQPDDRVGARLSRALGCLIEKEATTPDNYPLTLNSLRNACNQSHEPRPGGGATPTSRSSRR